MKPACGSAYDLSGIGSSLMPEVSTEPSQDRKKITWSVGTAEKCERLEGKQKAEKAGSTGDVRTEQNASF